MTSRIVVIVRTEAYSADRAAANGQPSASGTLSAVRTDPRTALLAWYGDRRALYPWRGTRGTADLGHPYRVLVSEVMLQQTQVARVVPAYRAFLRRFPTVEALAAAPRSEVVRAWSGLGHNRRAVALSETARAIVRDHAGRVPADPAVLAALPGVGPYTAAAVASLAHGVHVPALDTNARRVVARAVLGAEPSEVAVGPLREAAERWMDRSDPGGWNQAVMDLGREVCRMVPRCEACPLARWCRYRRAGRPERPPSPARRQGPFAGSSRELRGRIVAVLRGRSGASLSALSREVGRPLGEVARSVAALSADGLVQAGAAVLSGRPAGRVRLAR